MLFGSIYGSFKCWLLSSNEISHKELLQVVILKANYYIIFISIRVSLDTNVSNSVRVDNFSKEVKTVVSDFLLSAP